MGTTDGVLIDICANVRHAWCKIKITANKPIMSYCGRNQVGSPTDQHKGNAFTTPHPYLQFNLYLTIPLFYLWSLVNMSIADQLNFLRLSTEHNLFLLLGSGGGYWTITPQLGSSYSQIRNQRISKVATQGFVRTDYKAPVGASIQIDLRHIGSSIHQLISLLGHLWVDILLFWVCLQVRERW